MERIDETFMTIGTTTPVLTWLSVGRNRYDNSPISQGPVLWMKVVNHETFGIEMIIQLRDGVQERFTVGAGSTVVYHPDVKDRADIIGFGSTSPV